MNGAACYDREPYGLWPRVGGLSAGGGGAGRLPTTRNGLSELGCR